MSPADWMWTGVLVAIVPLLCLGALIQRGVQCVHPTSHRYVPQEPAEAIYWPSERPAPPQIVVIPVAMPPNQVQYLPYPQYMQLPPRVIDALSAIEGSWSDGTSQGQW